MTDQADIGPAERGPVTGLEHFRAAEALAMHARQLREASVPGQEADAANRVREVLAEAQVHATLAVAAGLLGGQLGAPAGHEVPPDEVPRVHESGGLEQLAAYLDQVDRPEAGQ